jgi:hypothetical protein
MSEDIFTKAIYVLPQYITIMLTKNVVSRARVKIIFPHESVRNFLETMNVCSQNSRGHAKEILKCPNGLWHDPINNFLTEILKL